MENAFEKDQVNGLVRKGDLVRAARHDSNIGCALDLPKSGLERDLSSSTHIPFPHDRLGLKSRIARSEAQNRRLGRLIPGKFQAVQKDCPRVLFGCNPSLY